MQPPFHASIDYQAHLPGLVIDGESIRHGRDTRPVVNPATGLAMGDVVQARARDVSDAAASAADAFPRWAATPPDLRGSILNDAAALLSARAELVAELVALEVGKPLAQAQVEVAVAAQTLAWFAQEGRRSYGRIIPGTFDGIQFSVRRQPVGVVAAFATWNFPVINAARKIGAALAAGCTCVYKPDEEAPAAGFAVARALFDAGLPAGVLCVLFGDAPMVSGELLDAPQVRKLSFTGSVAVGRHLGKLAAERNIRTTMELGGHAPVIVCADADLEAAARQMVASKFRNSGQVCVAPTRILVQDAVFDAFAERFVAAARALKVGNPLDPQCDMGPLIHERRRIATEDLVHDAQRAGAKVLCGGDRKAGPGFYYLPTVLARVPLAARAMTEEPFGPVALVNAFGTLEEAILEANRLPLGLAAYVYSSSHKSVRILSQGVDAGMVAVNTAVVSRVEAPFSGVRHSGHGAENGIEGLDAYLTTKSISEAVI